MSQAASYSANLAARRPHLVGPAAVVLLYAAIFVVFAAKGAWLFDELGRPIASDFVNVWAAGRLVLQNHAAEAYDWAVHKSVEAAAVGYDFDGYFGWHYPPPFLAIAAPLALISYPLAHLVWMAVTLPLYSAAVGVVARRAEAALWAVAFPAAFWNFDCGQNGFVTAALLGFALVHVEKRPSIAGILIGLLTYKPQFGLLIPVALLAGGHWRALIAASLTAVALVAGSGLAFGADAWLAFVRSTRLTNQVVLVEGRANFAELLSPYGMTRWLGAGVTFAWTVQGVVAAALAAWIWRVWRGAGPFEAKAALLTAAALLATPYIYVYDLTLLAVAMAFLLRTHATRAELRAMIVVSALVLIGPLVGQPLAFVAAPIVVAMASFRLTGR